MTRKKKAFDSYNPIHPYREALAALMGAEPPIYVLGYDTSNLTEHQQMELQDWAATNAKPEWALGITMLEAADQMVHDAVGNDNIPPQPKFEDLYQEVATVTVVQVDGAPVVRLKAKGTLLEATMDAKTDTPSVRVISCLDDDLNVPIEYLKQLLLRAKTSST